MEFRISEIAFIRIPEQENVQAVSSIDAEYRRATLMVYKICGHDSTHDHAGTGMQVLVCSDMDIFPQ